MEVTSFPPELPSNCPIRYGNRIIVLEDRTRKNHPIEKENLYGFKYEKIPFAF